VGLAQTAAERGCAAVSATLDADPGALRDVVTGFRSDASTCAAAAESLSAVASVALPAGLVGATGTAVGETITATLTSLRQEAEGQELVAQHLSTYADALDELTQAQLGAQTRAETGRSTLAGITVPDFGRMHGIFGWDSPFHDDF